MGIVEDKLDELKMDETHIQEIARATHEALLGLAEEYLRPPEQRVSDGVGLLEGEKKILLSLMKRGISTTKLHQRLGVTRETLHRIEDKAIRDERQHNYDVTLRTMRHRHPRNSRYFLKE